MVNFVGMSCLRPLLSCCLLVAFATGAEGQTLGGAAAYSFLRVPAGPLANALGTANVSVLTRDVSVVQLNPALLRAEMEGQLAVAANQFFSGARQVNGLFCLGVGRRERTLLAAGIDYFDYGTAAATDLSGNRLGEFRARDHVARVTATRAYGERWRYGLTLKYAGSAYGIYRSDAILADVGLTWTDTSGLLQAGFVARNMGAQVRTYAGRSEDMPFDLQFGISRRLRHAPLQFSLTAQRAHRFDIRYRDTVSGTPPGGLSGPEGFIDNLFRHLVLSVQGYVGDKVELTLGYNHLRRAELSIPNAANGMSGFSFGAGVMLKRLQVRYARAVFLNGLAYSQFGLSAALGRSPQERQ